MSANRSVFRNRVLPEDLTSYDLFLTSDFCFLTSYFLLLTHILLKEPVLHQHINNGEAVFPADLLTFPELAARVRNGYLVDAVAHSQHLGGDLRVEAPAIRLEPQLAGDIRREHLVAGLHIRKGGVEEDV